MRSAVALLAALVIAAPLTWLAGEQHRENCIRDGNSGCSVLPWVAGHAGGNTLDTEVRKALRGDDPLGFGQPGR